MWLADHSLVLRLVQVREFFRFGAVIVKFHLYPTCRSRLDQTLLFNPLSMRDQVLPNHI